MAAASACKNACVLPCKAYNSASGSTDEFAHKRALFRAGIGLTWPPTRREAVPYPFFFFLSDGSGGNILPPSSPPVYGNHWLAVPDA